MFVSVSGLPLDELDEPGLVFVQAFARERRGSPDAYTAEAAQAAEVALDAIARSDGTRTSVLREVRRTDVASSILGGFRFDGNGDITPAPVTIYRVTGATSQRVFKRFRGAIVDQVVRVPESLLD